MAFTILVIIVVIILILIIMIASGKTAIENISIEKDSVKITTLIDCLADKGVKIYGANWCEYTKKFVVETIGGFGIAAPIYVECTENEAECSDAGVKGYPTTKINGRHYNGERTLQGLAQATGCKITEETIQVQTSVTNSNTAGGCGA